MSLQENYWRKNVGWLCRGSARLSPTKPTNLRRLGISSPNWVALRWEGTAKRGLALKSIEFVASQPAPRQSYSGDPFLPPVGPDFELNNSLRGNRSSTTNTVKMARRPARCYRYCKNKVRELFCTPDDSSMGSWGWDTFSHPSLRPPFDREPRPVWAFNIQSANHCVPSSRIPSPGSTVVSPTPRSRSSILAASVRRLTISLSACTSSPTSMSSLAPRPSRPLVSAPTSESPKTSSAGEEFDNPDHQQVSREARR